MMNYIKIILIIIGALIGAGFASGQEIYVFFYSYGIEGMLGIIVSSFILGIIIYKSLIVIKKNNIRNYKEFLENIMPKNINGKLRKNIVDIINKLTNIFMLITFYIMLAGFGAYLNENINVPQIIGSIILAIICIIILSKDLRGIIKINEVIVPVLILFIFILGILSLKNLELNLFDLNSIKNIQKYIVKVNKTNWLISAILYATYNSILLIPVLISIKDVIEKDYLEKISFSVSGLVFVLGIAIYMSMVKINVDINKLEMPVAYVVSNQYVNIKLAYGIVILSSILTTAVSIGNGLLNNIIEKKDNKIIGLIVICIIGVFISQIGFSNLISYLYPMFGYLGVIIFLLINLKVE